MSESGDTNSFATFMKVNGGVLLLRVGLIPLRAASSCYAESILPYFSLLRIGY